MASVTHQPDLGDLVIVLLASTLAGLRDRLSREGFHGASELVVELTERCDSYVSEGIGIVEPDRQARSSERGPLPS